MRHQPAFTLAELLISLSILGVIAAFTIPKVLSAQQNGQFNARAKEAAGMISGAYQAFQSSRSADANTAPGDLTPYMNYVSIDTTSTLDDLPGSLSFPCDGATNMCLKLHSGATIEYNMSEHFGGTNTTNAIFFYLDPDSRYSGSINGEGKSVTFFLYFNSRLSTWGQALPGTSVGIYGGTTYTADPNKDPQWFSWGS